MIIIHSQLIIPDDELQFTASRSGGPGGQNVNKVNTRVTLWFNVDASPSLTQEQKNAIHRALPGRINKNGQLWIVSKQHRNQLANRQAAAERFAALLQQALTPAPLRKKTRIPVSAKKKRLEEKRHRSRVKYNRSHSPSLDE